MKRLIVAVLTLALVGAGAWVVADRVESPDQMAARAEPPAPDPVVAPLARGYLNGPVSVSAVAGYEETVAIKGSSALAGVVTSVEKRVGDTLQSGAVLMRVNGRPLFVLSGAFALYRDIQRGDGGDDVLALQASLTEAGFSIGRDRAGVFGWGTQSALRDMYEAAGYDPPETPVVAAPAADGDPEGAPTSGQVATSVAGPPVLQTELMMVTHLPATVVSIASVGTQVSIETDLVTLGAGQVVLAATLPTGSLGALTVGATGVFTDDSGAEGTAAVAAVNPAESGDQEVLVLTPTGGVTPGSSYVLAIDNPAAEPGDSLLVPIAAVVTRGGHSYVYVHHGSVFTEVEVQVTGSVGGVGAIVPVDATVALDEGTEVRVG